MFQFTSLPLPQAQLISLPSFNDARGNFTKTFHQGMFQEHGINFELKESYFSISKKDVIRGIHFQTPPHEHAKIVFCPKGAILDVIVDIRKESPFYGKYYAAELNETNHQAYYIPEGFAHGFMALTEGAITYYLVSSMYSQPHDTGIRYDSIGYDWGIKNPLLSERDLSFISFKEFESPF